MRKAKDVYFDLENDLGYKLINDILYDHLFRIAVNNKKISFSLRKTINSQKKIKVFLASYQRPNFILTPHVSWASMEAMQNLSDQLIDNIENFVAGKPSNIVSGDF